MAGMTTPALQERSGALIVRVWIEATHEIPLRARITQSLDAAGPEHSVAAASSAKEICEVVRAWVDAFETAAVTPS